MTLHTRTKSLRSTKIELQYLSNNPWCIARLMLDDGESSIDVRDDGQPLLLVCRLPEAFWAEVLDQLLTGQGGRKKIHPETMNELAFRIKRQVEIGDEPLVQCFFQGKFFRVFYFRVRIVEAIVA